MAGIWLHYKGRGEPHVRDEAGYVGVLGMIFDYKEQTDHHDGTEADYAPGAK